MKLKSLLGGLMMAMALAGCIPQPPPQSVQEDWKQEALDVVNSVRANAGLAPVTLCESLNVAADAHALDQALHRRMSHVGSDGADFVKRDEHAGYRDWTLLGENVAAGQDSVADVMSAWRNSPGHLANIVKPGFTHMGLGSAVDGGSVRYWSQEFGASGTC